MDAELAGKRQHGFAGNALEIGRGRRRHQRPIDDDEQVVDGRFGDVAVLIEEHRLVGTAIVGLDARQDVVQIVEAFDGRTQHVGRRTPERRGHHAAALHRRVRI